MAGDSERNQERDSDPAGSAADSIFATFLARRALGDIVEFDAIIAAHAEHKDALKLLHSRWLHLNSLLSGVVGGPSEKEALDSADSSSDEDLAGVTTRLLERLRLHGTAFDRYRIEAEPIGRGGQGVILRAFDSDLRRDTAMKLLRGQAGARGGSLPLRELRRFVDEARVMAGLEHPGIVPVYELGMDVLGRVYFSMRIVRGQSLAELFERVEPEGDIPRVRAIDWILKACQAVAYAHSKGVIHRDLKPQNIMVGEFGVVYVMDWGLVSGSAGTTEGFLQKLREPDWDSGAFDTVAGSVVGTLQFMSPEQASGDPGAVGEASDVFSMGAVLYSLLAGQAPYASIAEERDLTAAVRRIQRCEWKPLESIDGKLDPELVSICNKAMRRDPRERYASMSALAGDLEAYMEGRVVGAHEQGALAELRKWVGRNRALSGAMSTGFLILVIGLAVSWSQFRRAEARAEDVFRLSSVTELEELVDEADHLWPIEVAMIPRYQTWIERASALVDGDATYPGVERLRETRTRIRERGHAPDGAERTAWEFENRNDRWWHAQIDGLIARLERFSDPASGMIGSAAVSPEHGWGVQRRLDHALTVARSAESGTAPSKPWADAARDLAGSPGFRSLRLTPQTGLEPIGKDPRSGLWEFAHVQSGTAPRRDSTGELILDADSAIVLVLVPGGRFWMGSQRDDPTGEGFCPFASSNEFPRHEVELEPFFLSKYELTQAQWARVTGANPSSYAAPGSGEPAGDFGRHPVEQVSRIDAERVLGWLDLMLPTEAQWEYAARAGSAATWWFGDDGEAMQGVANLNDATVARAGLEWPQIERWLDDGFVRHAPIDVALRPHPYGLAHVYGNVAEWCRGALLDYSGARHGAGDGLLSGNPLATGVVRGGGYYSPVFQARSALRDGRPPAALHAGVGVRPARVVRGSN